MDSSNILIEGNVIPGGAVLAGADPGAIIRNRTDLVIEGNRVR